MRFYGFADLLGYWATQSPDRIALRGERESYSYAELQRRVLERTKQLQNSGKPAWDCSRTAARSAWWNCSRQIWQGSSWCCWMKGRRRRCCAG